MSQKHQFLQQVSFCVLQPNHKRHPDSVRFETVIFIFYEHEITNENENRENIAFLYWLRYYSAIAN